MSEDFGSDFITIVDDDGTEFELEVLDTMDYNGETYKAFLPGYGRERSGLRHDNPAFGA